MLEVLIGSLVLNVLLLGGAAWALRRAGGRAVLGRLLPARFAPRPDFAGQARARFVPPSSGAVILLGDSQLERAPLLDLLDLPVRNRAISGARTSDLAEWLDGVLAEQPAQLVLMIGSNDVWQGRPLAESAAALREVFARVAAGAGCPVIVVSVPPLLGRDGAVRRFNEMLAGLAAEFGHRFVDIVTPLAGTQWTDDGLHLNLAAYREVTPLVREKVARGI